MPSKPIAPAKIALRKRKEWNCSPGCPVEAALEWIGGKWKGVVLYHLLHDGSLRFGELGKKLPTVTQRMLTRQLRELERDGLVDRKVFPQVPPKVVYSLTERGKSLKEVIDVLAAWGRKHAL